MSTDPTPTPTLDTLCGCYDSTGELTCTRQPTDWVIGWYPYSNPSRPWFVTRESGEQYSEHEYHGDAVRHATELDSTVEFFHEADGGGCLGPFDPIDPYYYDKEH